SAASDQVTFGSRPRATATRSRTGASTLLSRTRRRRPRAAPESHQVGCGGARRAGIPRRSRRFSEVLLGGAEEPLDALERLVDRIVVELLQRPWDLRVLVEPAAEDEHE